MALPERISALGSPGDLNTSSITRLHTSYKPDCLQVYLVCVCDRTAFLNWDYAERGNYAPQLDSPGIIHRREAIHFNPG